MAFCKSAAWSTHESVLNSSAIYLPCARLVTPKRVQVKLKRDGCRIITGILKIESQKNHGEFKSHPNCTGHVDRSSNCVPLYLIWPPFRKSGIQLLATQTEDERAGPLAEGRERAARI